jgi:hypothetical protein
MSRLSTAITSVIRRQRTDNSSILDILWRVVFLSRLRHHCLYFFIFCSIRSGQIRRLRNNLKIISKHQILDYKLSELTFVILSTSIWLGLFACQEIKWIKEKITSYLKYKLITQLYFHTPFDELVSCLSLKLKTIISLLFFTTYY